jgi:hypothetical protein
LIKIKNWKDAKEKFKIDPYILNVADVFHRNRNRDVAFGILFSCAEDKISLLPFFNKIEIELANGSILKGSGYIQPFRENSYDKAGYLHFYDGKDFSLINPEEIKTVFFMDHSYIPVFDNFNKRWYLGFKFEYKGNTYRVAEGFSCPVNYGFFGQDGDPRFLIFSQKKNGKYFLENDKDLWNAFNKDMTGGGSR